jgi:hypothetical protein
MRIVKRAIVLALVSCSLAVAACISVNVAAPGDGARIAGPLDVAGPLRVQGDLHVGGPATIHGPVQARALTVAGPVKTTYPRGEPPGPAGQAFATSLAVGGPLSVQGPLVVEGALVVAGPLTSEPGQEASDLVPQQSQVFAPRGDLPSPKPLPQAEWTE